MTLTLLRAVSVHSVGHVTAGEMTLYMRRSPESPTRRQWEEQTVRTVTHLMIGDESAALSDTDKSNQYKLSLTSCSWLRQISLTDQDSSCLCKKKKKNRNQKVKSG